LRAYSALERAMVDLDDAGDPLGDELRDRMDPIWLRLSAQDRAALDSRTGDPSQFAGRLGAQGVKTEDRRDLCLRREVRDQWAA
jgi:hypothetical protein